MPDLLVNLLNLPDAGPHRESLASAGIIIRRAQPFEITKLRTFIEREFSTSWADEVSVGFAHQPVSVFVATAEKEIVGFAAYECTRRSFFGPTAVSETMRGKGVGKVLLFECLHGLREMGYVYAIIGHAGPIDFYQKTVGAVVIPDSDPGIYTDLLK
jgi:predicted N-acetyltransferase YhbS